MFHAEVEGEAEFLRECQAFETGLREGARASVEAAVKAGAAVAKQGAWKDRTGNLRDRIYGTVEQTGADGTEGEIWASQPYASYVENGTAAHVITAKNAKYLKWQSGGETHYAKSVNHPGSRSIPFMGPAYIKAEAVLTARMEEASVKAGEHFK